MIGRSLLAAAIFVAILTPCFAEAKQKPAPITPSEEFEMIDVRTLGGMISGMYVAGDLVLLQRGRGLEFVDFSSPAHPKLLSRFDLPKRITDFAVRGRAAYVGVSRSGLHMIDFSNPRAPKERGCIVSESLQVNVGVEGNYLWVYPHYKGDGDFRYLRIDRDPWRPEFKWKEDFNRADNCAVVAGVAYWMQTPYLKDQRPTLLVRSPDGTQWKMALQFPGDGARLLVQDKRGAVLMKHRLFLLDLKNPLKPAIIGELTSDQLEAADSGFFTNDFLLVEGDSPKLINISDPRHPRLTNWKSSNWIHKAWPVGNILLMRYQIPDSETERYRFTAIDLSNSMNPQEVTVPIEASNREPDVSIHGEMAYVLADDELKVLDCSNPKAIRLRGRIGGLKSPDPEMAPRSLLGPGALIFVADQRGVEAIDLSLPDHPKIIGTYHTVAQNPVDIALARTGDGRSVAWVANDSGRLEALDMAVPSGSDLLGSIDLHQNLDGLKVNGRLAYVTAGDEVLIVDIANAQAPSLVTTLQLSDEARQVAITDKLLLAACVDRGLLIYNVENPARPQKVAEYSPGADFVGVAARGGLAYLAGRDFFDVVNVADPQHPKLLGRARGTEDFAPGHVLLYKKTAYMPQLVDVSTPASPHWIGSFKTDISQSECLAGAGRFVYTILHESWAGGTDYTLTLYDAVNPLKPVEADEYDRLLNTYAAAADEAGNIFIADGIGGVVQLRVAPKTTIHKR